MAFVIPSIFTVIDKLTTPVQKMGRNVEAFAGKMESGIARGERMFRKFTPALSEAGKQFLSMASAATLVAAIVAGITFSVVAIKDYEKAVASFRTIVGGTDKEFSAYQDKINEVARDTKKSSIETAAAFEKIAGLNAKFADTAEHIGLVSKAVITLSKASGDELGPSAESLVGIMNQFSLGADQANRTINVLAAGAGVGAASIVQTAESFTMFGAVASGANVTLEQSVGLIQTLGKFSLFGSEAGNQLKGTILRLQAAGLGYKSGQFKINDALEETAKHFNKLKSAKEKDAYLSKVFGAINISTGRILVGNIKTFQEFTNGVTGTNAAQEQAAIRSNTLSTKLDELKAAWINMLTGSSSASQGLDIVKRAIGFVTSHLGEILMTGVKVIAFFAAWKAILIAGRISMIAYNVVLGITNALNGASAFTVMGNTVAYGAFRAAVVAQTIAQRALNIVMNMSPLGLAITATAALTVASYGLVKAIRSTNVAQSIQSDLQERVLEKTVDQRVQVIELFGALKNLKVGSEAYNATLEKIDAIQPGITSKYDLQRGAIQNMAAAERELTANIMKRAEAEAKADLLRDAIRNKLQLQAEGPSMLQKITGAMGGPNADLLNKVDIAKEDMRINALAKMVAVPEAVQAGSPGNAVSKIAEGADNADPNKPANTKKILNPTGARQDALVQKMEATNNAKVDINIKDDTGRAEAKTDSKFTKIKTTSTSSMSK